MVTVRWWAAGGCGEAVLPGLGGDERGGVALCGGGGGLLAGELLDDAGLHVGETLGSSGVLGFGLDDVGSRRRSGRPARSGRARVPWRLWRRRDQAARWGSWAARRPRPCCRGSSEFFLARSAKVGAGLDLLEEVFGLGLGGSVGLGVGALGNGDENVAASSPARASCSRPGERRSRPAHRRRRPAVCRRGR